MVSTMELEYITDRDGIEYLMYAMKQWRFDTSRVSLCFENDEITYSGTRKVFDTLEIDTRFCALIDYSVHCDVKYVNNILAYINEHREYIRKFLNDFLSPREMKRFFEQLRPSVASTNIGEAERHQVRDLDGVPTLSLGTARKRFFVLGEFGYEEVGMTTAMAIYGREEIIGKCQQLNYLTGIGANGRAIWLNGLGIQDVDRDRICGGWCR